MSVIRELREARFVGKGGRWGKSVGVGEGMGDGGTRGGSDICESMVADGGTWSSSRVSSGCSLVG